MTAVIKPGSPWRLLGILLILWLGFSPWTRASDAPKVPTISASGAFIAKFVGDRNNISIIELSGSYDRNDAGGEFNAEPRAVIAREFFRNHPDNYDMLVVFTGFPIATGDAIAFHHAVRNGVQGIGRPVFDNTALYGSGGKLQGYIDMAHLGQYQTDTLGNRFDFTIQVFAHEFMHQFGAFVRYKKADGTLSEDLLGRDKAHWNYLLNSDASLMYGSRWRDNGDGTFTAVAVNEIYSELDLYLMGMLGAEEVAPFFVIEAPGEDKTQLSKLNAQISGVRRDVRIDDVIAAEGARSPGVGDAQKDFRFAFVYIVRPGQVVEAETVAALNNVRREIGVRFNVLTHGRANANVFAEPAQTEIVAPPVSPLPKLPGANAVDLAAGQRWLETRQRADGAWADDPATAGRDSAVVLGLLSALNPGFAGLAKGLGWLTQQPTNNTDYLARSLRTRALLGRSPLSASLAVELTNRQNGDGGWALGGGYLSDPLDTALALQALRLRAEANDGALAAGVAYLLGQQNGDGGWGQLAGGASRTTVTAEVLNALRGEATAAAALERGKGFLVGRQNADGGFGDSPSSEHDTAQALLALMALNASGDIDAAKAIQYLSSAQRADGSWQGSGYATALALDALSRANAMNWAVVSFSATPGTVSDGQRVTLKATVGNSGNQIAPAATVQFYDGDPAAGGAAIGGAVALPLLAPGATATVSTVWNTFNKGGAHQLYLVVDPGHSQSELSVADNTAILTYTVGGPVAAVDLAVGDADLTATPAHPSRIPSALTVAGLLTNAGRTRADRVHVVLWEGEGVDRSKAGETTVDLPARSTLPVSFAVTLNRNGTTVYTVEIDPEGAIAESDKSNNQARIAVSTTAAVDLEVTAGDLTADKSSARVGDDLVFTVKLRNRGTSDVDGVKVRYSMLDGTGETEILVNAARFAAGQTLTHTIPWRADRAGTLNFKAAIDPDNQIAETDESNNTALLPVTVIAVNGPNLAVSYKDLRVTPEPVLAGRNAQIGVVLRNTGTRPLSAAEVAFYLGDPAQQGVQIGTTQSVAELAAGAEQTVAVTWPVSGSGEYFIFAVADPGNKISDEISKDDNRAFIKVAVKSLPDLAVSAGDLELTPGVPKPGQATTLTAKISNLGQQAAENVVVRLYDGEPGQGGVPLGGDRALTNLAAQGSGQVDFTWSFPADNRTHTLYVVVDPDEAIAESDEGNNRASVSVAAQDGDFSVDQRYFSPNGDGIKDSVTLSFRLKAPTEATVRVVDSGGAEVRRYRDPAWQGIASGQWRWDGLNDRGSLVRDDEYRLQVVDGRGTLLGEARVILDTNRAPLLDAVGTPYGLNINLTCQIPQSITFDPAYASYMPTEQTIPFNRTWDTSADGSAHFFIIGYQSNVNELPTGIYRIGEWGGDLRQVVPGPAPNSNVGAWADVRVSPDGGRIAMLKYGDYDPVTRRTGDYEIWVASSDGQGRKRLNTGIRYPSSLLGFSRSGAEIFFWAWDASNLRIYAAAVDSLAATRDLGTGRDMQISPDHRKMYVADAGNGNGAVIDLDTGARTALPNSGYDYWVWSPDSQYLAAIYRGSAPGPVPASVTSPAPERAAARSAGGSPARITVFAVDGTPVVDRNDFYMNSDFRSGTFSWSEDASELYLAMEEDCAEPGGSCNQGVVRRLRLSSRQWSDVYRIAYPYPSNPPGLDSCSYGSGLIFRTVPGRDQTLVDVIIGRPPYDGCAAYEKSVVVDNAEPHASRDLLWPPDGLPEMESVFAEYGRALYYRHQESSGSGRACAGNHYQDNWAFRTLQNLTADLRYTRTALGTSVNLLGTATDQNFSRYLLEYTDASHPGVWAPIAPAATEPVIDDLLAQWTPPAPGTYLLRLTVEDRAGNREQAIKRLGWGENALITDVYRSPQYISPNGDGLQDRTVFHYRVVEPVNLEFAIYNDRGDRIRTMVRSHTAIGVEVDLIWDGRDDLGQTVADGTYWLRVLDYEFPITVDSTAPAAVAPATDMLQLSGLFTVCSAEDRWPGFVCARPQLHWQIADANFGSIQLGLGEGQTPASWSVLRDARETVGQLDLPQFSIANYALDRFRLEARDLAGNSRSQIAPPGTEELLLLGFAFWPQDKLNAAQGDSAAISLSTFPLDENPISHKWVTPDDFVIQADLGSHGLLLQVVESVRSPLARVTLQYRFEGGPNTVADSDWRTGEIILPEFYTSGQTITDFAGKPDMNWRSGAASLTPQPADHLFLTRWDMKELTEAGRYRFRVKAVAQDGGVFYSKDYPIEKKAILAVVDIEAALDGAHIFAFEDLGRPVASIDLVFSGTDPFYVVPRVIATFAGTGTLVPLGGFDALVSARLMTCRDYEASLRAKMVDGSTVNSSPYKFNFCERIKSLVEPVFATDCGQAPPGKLRVSLKVERPKDGDPIVPLQHLVFGRTRSDGSDDILFNIVNPEMEQWHSFELDTAGIADGQYGYFARSTDIDGHLESVGVPVTIDHVSVAARITYPIEGQRVCGRPVTLSDGSVVSGVPIEAEISDTGGFDYVADFGMGSQPVQWSALGANPPGCLTRYNRFPEDDSRKCGAPLPLAGHRLAGAVADSITEVSGEITARLKVRDWGGYQVCPEVRFSVDAGVDAGLFKVDRRLISPGTASELADVAASFAVGETLVVDAEVYRKADATFSRTGRLLSLDGPVVKTLAHRQQTGVGDTEYRWDGRDDGGNDVVDGDYLIVLTLEDGCGNRKRESLEVEVDRTAPEVAIDYPGAADALTQIVEAVGVATDKNFAGYVLELGEGTSPEGWLALSGAEQPAEHERLGRWNTAGLVGLYTLRLRAEDLAGNRAETRVTVNLAARTELLAYYEAQPELFSPNGDGRREYSMLRLQSAVPVAATLTIYDGTTIVRRLLNGAIINGASTVAWDGTDDGGRALAEKAYRAELTVVAQANGNLKQTENITVVIDRTAPAIQLTQPAGAYVRGGDGITGSITDPHLNGYTLTLQGLDPVQAAFVLERGKDERRSYRFADLSGQIEGRYRLKAEADDLAENHSETVLEFELDNTPPKVAFSAPAAGAIVGGKGGLVGITGTIDERNLKQFALNLGQGAPPYPTALASGTRLPLATPLHNLDVARLADGTYTLQLVAEDLAGWIGQATTSLTVDNTPPVAAIRLPGEGALLRGATDILGTATDANFAQYQLDLAPGLKGQASRWSPILTGTAAVSDDKLGRLTSLPPDGDHTLRLTVSDKAGNSATALVQIRIDTTPPAAPLKLNAKVERRQDVALDWSAVGDADLQGYHLYRDGILITATPITATRYTDAGVAEGKHGYTVRAIDNAGNESPSSNRAEITISLATPIATLLSPANNSRIGGLVDIKGSAFSARDFKEYRLQIGAGASPGQYAQLVRSPVAVQGDLLGQWNTVGLNEGAPYTIKLEAEDTYGNQAEAQIVVTVDNLPPAKPTGLQAVPAGNDVTLSWNANGEADLDGYLLYRDGRLANADGPVIGSLKGYLIRDTHYLDKAVVDGVHDYTVVAVDLAGNESPPSDPARATLDNRAPHASIVQPTSGSKVDRASYILATCPDTDVAGVLFQYKAAAATAWTDLAPVSDKAPYHVTWNPQGLAYGDYQLRAVATDRSGHTDPAPTPITLTYTVLDRPAAPSGLTARVNGGDVALNWTASPAAGVVGYHLDRIDAGDAVVRITGTPVAATQYTDPEVSDGRYRYQVVAIDGYGNLSDPAGPAPALVFTPTLKQPYTPTEDGTAVLRGRGQAGQTALVTRANGARTDQVAAVVADGQGGYVTGAVALLPGDNRIRVLQQDGTGNTSKPATAHVVVGAPPVAPTGLSGTAAGLDVTLNWNANSEADLAGYTLAIDGEARQRPVAAETATASLNPGQAGAAIDGGNGYAWWLGGAISEEHAQWLELKLAGPELLTEVAVSWYSTGYMAADFDLDAWDGEVWVPLAEIRNNTDATTTIALPRPYRSDRLRLHLYRFAVPDQGLAIDQVALRALDTVGAPGATVSAANGQRRFSVRAFNQLGLIGAAADLGLAVGDVVAPAAVVLQGSVQGADIQLTWTASPAADLAGYALERDGQAWLDHSDLNDRTQTDPGKANGTYRYRVYAVDGNGNRSPASNEVALTVAQPLPAAVLNLTVSAPSIGGALDLTWSVAANGPAPAGYRILRGEHPGGPYQRLSALPVTEQYRDSGLSNGVRYYYRVYGEDAVGNSGAPSNEADGIPIDSEQPAAPVLIYPAVAGIPVTVTQGTVAVMGFAEPGANVRINRNGVAAGSVSATAAAEAVTLWTAGPFSLAPDGGRLAVGSNGQLQIFQYTRVNGQDAVAPIQTLNYANLLSTPGWSADGGNLAYLEEIYDAGQSAWIPTLRYWTAGDGQVRTVAPVAPVSFAWAAAGKRLYLSGRATDGSNTDGLWSLDLESGALALLLASGGDLLYGLSAAPDGRHLAYLRNDLVEILDLATKNPTPIDPNPANSPPAWSYDGGALLYSVGYPGQVFRVDLSAPTPMAVTDGSSDCRNPVWSPDGRRIAHAGERAVIRDLASGAETVLTTDYTDRLEWTQSGYLSYLANYDRIVRLKPAGHFTLPTLPLLAGDNELTASAVDGSGNGGAESAPAHVLYSTADRPDLAIGAADLALLPALPSLGERTRITVTVRNLGRQAAAASDLTLVVLDDTGRIETLYQGQLEPLPVNGSQSLYVDWTPPRAGAYRLAATVDRNNDIAEVSEDNNVMVRDLRVLAAAKPLLELGTDRSSYDGGAPVAISTRITNGGGDFSGTLELTIEDGQGYLVQSLPTAAIGPLAYGQSATPGFTWNTGQTLGGSYRVHGRLKGGDGSIVSEAVADFVLRRADTVSAGLVTDSAEYDANRAVALLGSVQADAGAQGKTATARFRIVQGAAQYHEDSQTIVLGPYLDLKSTWNTGSTAPGDYTATLEILLGGTVVASAQSPFRINKPTLDSIQLSGKLSLSSHRLMQNATLSIDAALRNRGNLGLLHLPVTIRVMDPAGNRTLDSRQTTVDLAAGGSAAVHVDFAAAGWPLRTLTVLLEIDRKGAALAKANGGTTQLLDQQDVSLYSENAPLAAIVSPAAGAYLQTAGTLVGTAQAVTGAHIVATDYRIDGGGWTVIAGGESPTGDYRAVLPALADGDHWLEFRATDQFGNPSTPARTDIVIDSVPPRIVIDRIADGGNYPPGIVPAITVADLHLATTVLRLDGAPYSAGSPIGQPGPHWLEVSADDLAGNAAHRRVDFTVQWQSGPPRVAIAAPNDGAYLQSAGLLDASAYGQAAPIVGADYRIDGGAWTAVGSPANAGRYNEPLPPLADGPHTLEFRATDQLGGVAVPAQTRIIIDSQPPDIVIDRVAAGGSYAAGIVPLITISDAHLAGTSQMLDGQPYTSGSAIVRGGNHVLNVTATDLAGNRAQRSLSFTVRGAAAEAKSIPADRLPPPLWPLLITLAWLAYRPVRLHYQNSRR